MAARYPVMVDLAGRRCLVVGGGAVATRKVLGLLAADADVHVLAPALTAPLAELANSQRITWTKGTYTALGSASGGRPWWFIVAAGLLISRCAVLWANLASAA